MKNIEYRNLAIAIAELQNINAQLGVMYAKYMANEYMSDEAIEEVYCAKCEAQKAIAHLSKIQATGEDIYTEINH